MLYKNKVSKIEKLLAFHQAATYICFLFSSLAGTIIFASNIWGTWSIFNWIFIGLELLGGMIFGIILLKKHCQFRNKQISTLNNAKLSEFQFILLKVFIWIQLLLTLLSNVYSLTLLVLTIDTMYLAKIITAIIFLSGSISLITFNLLFIYRKLT